MVHTAVHWPQKDRVVLLIASTITNTHRIWCSSGVFAVHYKMWRVLYLCLRLCHCQGWMFELTQGFSILPFLPLTCLLYTPTFSLPVPSSPSCLLLEYHHGDFHFLSLLWIFSMLPPSNPAMEVTHITAFFSLMHFNSINICFSLFSGNKHPLRLKKAA